MGFEKLIGFFFIFKKDKNDCRNRNQYGNILYIPCLKLLNNFAVQYFSSEKENNKVFVHITYIAYNVIYKE